jgi:hypothetical protein
MAEAYWVVCYRSISDPTARENYSKLVHLLSSLLAGAS